jgi:carbon monoxide dehydrogenase subunit G
MIETEQAIVIDAPIEAVWRYANDIAAWAKLMPGLQDCEIVDEDDSLWKLKIGVGALVRTVTVSVHVDRWAGPGEVDFTYALKGDPVQGVGTYRARSVSPHRTEIALGVQVIGTGPMAPMWEAMGKPLLPTFARAFAEQFKAEVEQAVTPGDAVVVPPGVAVRGSPIARPIARLVAWLRRLFGGAPRPREENLGEKT